MCAPSETEPTIWHQALRDKGRALPAHSSISAISSATVDEGALITWRFADSPLARESAPAAHLAFPGPRDVAPPEPDSAAEAAPAPRETQGNWDCGSRDSASRIPRTGPSAPCPSASLKHV